MSATPVSPAQPRPGERIDEVDVTSEMQESFLEYAYSVIYARALPDARDGLKPVQRRILFQMREMGLLPSRGHVKSARVVGDVMGRLHPHGDSPIYDALVRLAQPFSLRVPLVDGHGNFGSLDDGPAAARYTEARLDAAALALTDGLDEDTIDFIPNYDNTYQQPSVLPAGFPNLLVNGASGIAVGMATNMAPHNLAEVVGAAQLLLERPDASLDDLMAHVPGPDLPGGGIIVGLDGVREAYATGRGTFRTRAKVAIERTGRATSIVVTELPYLVGPERVIEKIKDGVQQKKLQGLADVQDLSDRTNGLRLVFRVKNGFDPEAVLQQLWRYTPLEDGFAINNVALVGGVPKTLGLKELLEVYLDHRLTVVRRRCEYRATKFRDRLHLVEGLLIAILDIDEVIQVIRSSDDVDTARTRLQTVFDLSERQAEYILELRLRRLTRFSKIELEAERGELLAQIAELDAILADPAKLRALVSGELSEVAERFGTPRRTLLTEASLAAPAKRGTPQLELADTPCRVIMSATGRVVRVDIDPAETIVAPTRRSRHDAIRSIVRTTTRGAFGVVTNRGRLLRGSPADLPVVPASSIGLAAGAKAQDLATLTEKGERIVGLVGLDDPAPIALGTALGVVKRVAVPTGGWPDRPTDIIRLGDGDEVVDVAHAGDEDQLVFVTSDAQLLRFDAAKVRPQGPPAGGMAGISLSGGARVIAFAATTADAVVVTISQSSDTLLGTDEGRAKVSDLEVFPAKGRATGGVRCQSLLRGEDGLRLAWVGPGPALAVGPDGATRQLPESGAKRDSSGVALDAVIGAVGARLGDAPAQQ